MAPSTSTAPPLRIGAVDDPLKGLESATHNTAPPDEGPGEACPAEAAPERLEASRPATWRGESELPQMALPKPCGGTVLVIDLWSGVGGLTLALLALGLHCHVLSVELHDPCLHHA